ncbi:MAG: VOC family protein [Acidobacteria bacterium]|nr:VOC family protein [Acidobacteriota bacterium]
MDKISQKIHPFLWFDTQAEEAAHYYVSIFPNSSIGPITRFGEGGPGPKGGVMTVAFQLEGQQFVALNGGPLYKINEAVSFLVHCDNQAEVDHYWERLSEGGQPIQCGWLKDRFGVTRQVVPRALFRLLADPDPEKAARVTRAFMPMKKLDIAQLEAAWRGEQGPSS